MAERKDREGRILGMKIMLVVVKIILVCLNHLA